MLKFDRPTLVTLTAPTCSGKNFLRDAIEREFGWNRIVSTTTRSMRAGEVQGEDYHFISRTASQLLEDEGKFAELIEFRGTRYGVTKDEMAKKMSAEVPPMVILEPQGLTVYKKLCVDNGWDIFSIYIATTESVRIQRLVNRSVSDLVALATKNKDFGVDDVVIDGFDRIIETHTDRLLSITGDERRWSNMFTWDAILPGDNVEKALADLKAGVSWRNRKVQPPAPYVHVA